MTLCLLPTTIEANTIFKEKTGYTGRILEVGIAYDRKAKEHTCEIEVLEEKWRKDS